MTDKPRPSFAVKPEVYQNAVSKVGPVPTVGVGLREAVTWNA